MATRVQAIDEVRSCRLTTPDEVERLVARLRADLDHAHQALHIVRDGIRAWHKVIGISEDKP